MISGLTFSAPAEPLLGSRVKCASVVTETQLEEGAPPLVGRGWCEQGYLARQHRLVRMAGMLVGACRTVTAIGPPVLCRYLATDHLQIPKTLAFLVCSDLCLPRWRTARITAPVCVSWKAEPRPQEVRARKPSSKPLRT